MWLYVNPTEFEKKIWFTVFEGARRAIEKLLRSAEDWSRTKMAIAETIANLILSICRSVKFIAVVEFSGGEVVDHYEGGFDIDLLIETESPAEAYALKRLEPIMDNAIKEAITYLKDKEFFRLMTSRYGKGFYHDVLELHVNDMCVEAMKRSTTVHSISILYRAT